MAKITLMPSGINAAISSPHQRTPGPRGKCKGWSAGACRRNARFLRSVVIRKLTGGAITFTLTVRDLPGSAEEWARIRKIWLDRLRAEGAIRFHWVTEWTKRGVPHLHVVAFFHRLEPTTDWRLLDAWTDLTSHLGSGPQGQHTCILRDASGWFQYVSKHSARGAGHYQRQMGALPETWDSIGRVWGRGGDWATSECEIEVSTEVFHRLRRLVRAWLVAQARSDLKRELRYGNHNRIRAARRRIGYASRMLRCHKVNLSTVRGLGHWVSGDAQEDLLSAAWTLAAYYADLDPIGQ